VTTLASALDSSSMTFACSNTVMFGAWCSSSR